MERFLMVALLLCCNQVFVATSRRVAQDTFKLTDTEIKALNYIPDGKFSSKDCFEVLENGRENSGWYIIEPCENITKRKIKVYCDQTTELKGWTIIQRNFGLNSMKFDWNKYKHGFIDGNTFWLGNDNIFDIFNHQTTPMRMVITTWDHEDRNRSTIYDSVTMKNEAHNYELCVNNITGPDPFGFSKFDPPCVNFSTYDRDNDFADDANCAEMLGGGMWYTNCTDLNVNGYNVVSKKRSSKSMKRDKADMPHDSFIHGMWWYGWKRQMMETLKKVEIKVRPVMHANCTAVRHALKIPQNTTFEGVYHIQRDPKFPGVKMRCYFDSEGDWIMIQRRTDGSLNFDLGWNDYSKGFGNLEGEFWWGLENIYANSENSVLKMEMWDWKGDYEFIHYSDFKVQLNELDFSKPDMVTLKRPYLSTTHFSIGQRTINGAYHNRNKKTSNIWLGDKMKGNATDCYKREQKYKDGIDHWGNYVGRVKAPHPWMQFSTKDHSDYSGKAKLCNGGWWFPSSQGDDYCKCVLNGLNTIAEYLRNKPDASIRWPGLPYKVHLTRMMIKVK